MPYGKLQLWERADYVKHFETHLDALDDEARDMKDNGVDISRCIKRPDGVHISAERDHTHYEIHFDPQNPETGHYIVSGGRFAGSGHVVDIREATTPSFSHYYYVKVVSRTAHHFAWRIAITSFSSETDEI
jgi:hypothetical protein